MRQHVPANLVHAPCAVDAWPLVALDYGGFWIGSRDCGPAFVRVTPFSELSEPAVRALREWAR